MKTTDFLDAVKARHGLPSDYAAAKFIGLTQAQISRYRTGKDFLSDAVAVKFAGWLDLPAEYVLACVHAERATDAAVARVWEKMASAMRKAGASSAAGLLLCASSAFTPGDALASGHHLSHSPTLYIMSTH